MSASVNRYEELRRDLDAGQFMRQARAKAGLSDYGDEGFVTSLDKLLDCLARETRFHPAGLEEFKEEVVRYLVNRLRFVEDVKRHAEILQEDVSDPIIILGLPRSGTTKTQRMMSSDTNLLKTYAWQLMNPAPFPDATAGQSDPRIAAAAAGDSLYARRNPKLDAAHHMAPEFVEEDWSVFAHAFNDWHPVMRNPSRSWHDWVISRTEPSDLVSYRYAHSIFQYLQWQQGGRLDRRWLMKSCGHLGHMKELIDTFPRATFVHIHRSPAVSIPSFAKIVFDVASLRVVDLDPESIGEIVLEWGKTCIHRYLSVRDRLALDGRIFDVQYEQIRTDPMPVFREIYRRAGHELTAEAQRGMVRWEESNEQGKHGKHNYDLAHFGLSEQKIADAFDEYIRRFIDAER